MSRNFLFIFGLVISFVCLILFAPERSEAKTVFLTTLEAERGDVGAQYDLGLRYFYGRSVKRDSELGIEWLNRAADNDSVKAMNRLGFLYLNGIGVPQSDSRAFEYYKRSAHLGSTVGQFNFGYLNHKGLGTSVNLNKAFQWYMVAAQKDYAEAQYNIGLMLLRGQGVIRDNVAAIQWLKKAGQLGHGKALFAIGTLFFGDLPSIPRHLDSARLYFSKSVENNYKPAGVNLAVMLEKGLGGKTNNILAHALLRWSEDSSELVDQYIKKISDKLTTDQIEQADLLYLALVGGRFETLFQ